jgi:hypothetical protein
MLYLDTLIQSAHPLQTYRLGDRILVLYRGSSLVRSRRTHTANVILLAFLGQIKNLANQVYNTARCIHVADTTRCSRSPHISRIKATEASIIGDLR